jgi:hypothetical protein
VNDLARWGFLLVLAVVAGLLVWYFLPPLLAFLFGGFELPLPLVWLLAALVFFGVLGWRWYGPRLFPPRP